MKKLESRNAIQILVKRLNLSSFKFKSGNMVKSSKSNLKEEQQFAKKVGKFHFLNDEGNEG